MMAADLGADGSLLAMVKGELYRNFREKLEPAMR
jgi:hypothetical protein